VFTNTWDNVGAYACAHVCSQRKVDLVLKSQYIGFTELLGFCLFLGS
jgi:hypothetical protein